MSNPMRMARTLLRGILRRDDLSILDEARVPMTVGLGDLDLNFHVTNSQYLRMMDIGRTDLLFQTGLVGAAWRLRARPVVGGSAIRYKAELRHGTEFDLVSNIVGWDDKWFYCHQAFRVDDRDRAVGVVKFLFHSDAQKFTPHDVLGAHRDGPRPSPVDAPSVAAWATEHGL